MTLKDKYNIISYVSERKDGALSRYIYLYSDKKNLVIRERIDTGEKNTLGYRQQCSFSHD